MSRIIHKMHIFTHMSRIIHKMHILPVWPVLFPPPPPSLSLSHSPSLFLSVSCSCKFSFALLLWFRFVLVPLYWFPWLCVCYFIVFSQLCVLFVIGDRFVDTKKCALKSLSLRTKVSPSSSSSSTSSSSRGLLHDLVWLNYGHTVQACVFQLMCFVQILQRGARKEATTRRGLPSWQSLPEARCKYSAANSKPSNLLDLFPKCFNGNKIDWNFFKLFFLLFINVGSVIYECIFPCWMLLLVSNILLALTLITWLADRARLQLKSRIVP